MIDFVKQWLKASPLFEGMEIRTDYLKPDNDEDYYSLEQENTPSPLVKANVLGTKWKGTVNFTLASRFNYDVHDDKVNSDNLNKMQLIIDWIIKQVIKGNYPTLNKNECVTDIEITSSPFLFGIDKSTTQSRYQFSFKIKYERRNI